MYDAVNAYCEDSSTIITSIPAFQDAFTDFQTLLDSIHSNAQLEADVITGIAADKLQARTALCQQAADLCAVMYAYAVSIGYNEMQQKADFTLSQLNRMKDSTLSLVCNNIRDVLSANVAALSGCGITAATVFSFDSAIKTFNSKMVSPRNAVSQRSSYSQTLSGLFKQVDVLLKNQMDKLAVQFKINYPDFFVTYMNNRTIVDPGTSPTRIAGTVLSKTNEPVAGALVQVVGHNVSSATDAEGNFDLRPLAIGSYSIKVSKEGFADDVIDNISVKLGKTTKLNAAIAPAAA